MEEYNNYNTEGELDLLKINQEVFRSLEETLKSDKPNKGLIESYNDILDSIFSEINAASVGVYR
ncbi:MAG: hypothetical protein PHQ66_02975 [Candidatus Nanoarchaeia archaeon]|nr:hypothetical protein [Candidatus Nanoarchaeia archaeon]MDD5357671.1 hypothetical protein [Candidatus Nanoarchaeia archaeon]MDD5588590.1 hypothetical protein [Candidatus Nanoarchaeia archaeon]